LQQWFERSLSSLSRKSDTAAAIRYALSRWSALLRYCDDGNIEIDTDVFDKRNLYIFSFAFRSWVFWQRE